MLISTNIQYQETAADSADEHMEVKIEGKIF
jgi:hypothetical protein